METDVSDVVLSRVGFNGLMTVNGVCLELKKTDVEVRKFGVKCEVKEKLVSSERKGERKSVSGVYF